MLFHFYVLLVLTLIISSFLESCFSFSISSFSRIFHEWNKTWEGTRGEKKPPFCVYDPITTWALHYRTNMLPSPMMVKSEMYFFCATATLTSRGWMRLPGCLLACLLERVSESEAHNEKSQVCYLVISQFSSHSANKKKRKKKELLFSTAKNTTHGTTMLITFFQSMRIVFMYT